MSVSSDYFDATTPDSSFATAAESYNFPLPPHEQSYWSPDTNGLDSPALATREPMPSFLAHPALHLLSPKAKTMGGAAVIFGVEETIDGALDFGWLVSAIDDGQSLLFPITTTEVEKPRPAPLNLVEAPVASPMATSSSMSSPPSSAAPSMHRAASRVSAFSQGSRSTAASSIPPPSVMDRKRPATNAGGLRYFGSVPDLRRVAAPIRRGSTLSIIEIAEEEGPSGLKELTRRSVEGVEENPRAAMLRMWLAAEQAERSRRRPLPALPVSEVDEDVNKPKTVGKRVKAWLGRLKRSPSSAVLEEEVEEDARDWVREPTVRRTRSIEAILEAAMA